MPFAHEEGTPAQDEEPATPRMVSLLVSPSAHPSLVEDPFFVSYEVNAIAKVPANKIDSHVTYYHSCNKVCSWFDKLSTAHRDILSQTSFYRLASLEPVLIPQALKTSLIEQWRPETHTFHLLMGKWGIYLLDVEMPLGLPSMAREGVVLSSLDPITVEDC